MKGSDWHSPPHDLNLNLGVVHAWFLNLDPPEALFQILEATLQTSEMERARRYRRPDLQRRFIAGRGFLRSILGRYLGEPANSIDFNYGPQGKPSLTDASSGLEFNLGHSKGIALLALTSRNSIGVDIETERPTDMAERIIHRFFSTAEQAEFLSMDIGARDDAFLRGWTRKEAFIKALGLGLAFPLDDFDVSLGPDNPKLLRVGKDPEEASRWTLMDLPAGDAAAVVVRGPIVEIRQFFWSGDLEQQNATTA